MTPDHASPEQVRGELIPTASDIVRSRRAAVRAALRPKAFRAARQAPRRAGARDLRGAPAPLGSVVTVTEDIARRRRNRRPSLHQSRPVATGAARRPRQHRDDGDAQGARAPLFLGRTVRRRHSALPDGYAGSGARRTPGPIAPESSSRDMRWSRVSPRHFCRCSSDSRSRCTYSRSTSRRSASHSASALARRLRSGARRRSPTC